MILRLRAVLLAGLTFLSIQPSLVAAQTQYVTYQNDDGTEVALLDDRKPALYTGNFGNCLGDSNALDLTRFDAAYYQDNMTVLFHLEGSSDIANASLMMYIGVYAYGESRFDLTFNPCQANIPSLCPLNSSVPIAAGGIIPVSQSDVANVPAIAFGIPDFEGQAILRVFSNATESEIACYSAVVTNGASFSQPASVGTILGVFTFVALCASFITAAYGEAVPTMRLHYAHSLSVGVVFAVFQHIFFTGALSMNWPSVLVAWWSNFAWAGGMIYSSSMQSSITHLIGNNVGNTSQVGAASSGSDASLGDDFDISQIYKRAFVPGLKHAANHPLMRDIASEIYQRPAGLILKRDVVSRSLEHTISRRELANASSGYKWYGSEVPAGLPLPGNFSGFAGTLAEEGIATSNAFMTGFLWFLILIVLLVAAMISFKWALEGLAHVKFIKQDRLKFFRDHWIRYTGSFALRIFYLAFFMMMFLTIFQFTYSSPGGVKAIAAIVFVIFLIGVPGLAIYSVLYKKMGDGESAKSRFQVEGKTLMGGRIPWFGVKMVHSEKDGRSHKLPPESQQSPQPFWRRLASDNSFTGAPDDYKGRNIHDDDDYTMKFGWLAARFRRSRWWFFTAWIGYEFLRAVFYGGASGYPLAQVFGLLIIEVLAFVFIIWAKPFEGRRLNVLVVYCLGFSKVMTVALSAAFDVQFNLPRITTTVIGVVIIVIQGILTIITMVAIVVGAISSYMSVSRNREDFRPRKWANLREKYFDHLDRAVNDLPPEPKPKPLPPPEPEDPKEPYFEMKNVRRVAKIEDEDGDFASEMRPDVNPSYSSIDEHQTPTRPHSILMSGNATPIGRSRAASVQSISQTNLPFGARPHRPSWSTRDFQDIDGSFTPVDMSRNFPDENSPTAGPSTSKASLFGTPSRSSTLPNQKLRAPVSNDDLQVGGAVSTRNSIGMVPAPTMRPRAGTMGSRPQSHNASGDQPSDSADDFLGGSRTSRFHPLTPAQELDEWASLRPSGEE